MKLKNIVLITAGVISLAGCQPQSEPQRNDFNKNSVEYSFEGNHYKLTDLNGDGSIDMMNLDENASPKLVKFIARGFENKIPGNVDVLYSQMSYMTTEQINAYTNLYKAKQEADYQTKHADWKKRERVIKSREAQKRR